MKPEEEARKKIDTLLEKAGPSNAKTRHNKNRHKRTPKNNTTHSDIGGQRLNFKKLDKKFQS